MNFDLAPYAHFVSGLPTAPCSRPKAEWHFYVRVIYIQESQQQRLRLVWRTPRTEGANSPSQHNLFASIYFIIFCSRLAERARQALCNSFAECCCRHEKFTYENGPDAPEDRMREHARKICSHIIGNRCCYGLGVSAVSRIAAPKKGNLCFERANPNAAPEHAVLHFIIFALNAWDR